MYGRDQMTDYYVLVKIGLAMQLVKGTGRNWEKNIKKK